MREVVGEGTRSRVRDVAILGNVRDSPNKLIPQIPVLDVVCSKSPGFSREQATMFVTRDLVTMAGPHLGEQ